MNSEFFIFTGLAFLIVTLLVVFCTFLCIKRFVHGRSDALLVVMGAVGKDKRAKILHGGVTFVWPIIQSYDWLSLTPVTVNLNLRGALSQENIRVNLPCAFVCAVDSENIATMETAAIRILHIIKNPSAFNTFIEDIIFGQMRSVIASMPISEINGNRQEFQGRITDAVSTELAKVGLKLLTVNIQDINDEAHYIENLGKRAAAEAEAKASIAIAEQARLGQSGSTANDAERRKNVSDNELLAIAAENENQAKIAQSRAELDCKTREAAAQNESRAAITSSNAEKEAALIRAANEVSIFEAQTKAQKSRETLAIATMAAETKPATEQMILQESAKGEAEGAKLQKRMEAEARGVAALMQARANGIKAVVEAAHGDAQAAVMLLMTDSLPDILKEYAKMAAERPIDKLVCINSSGSEKNDAVSNLTEAMIHAMPKIQEVIGALGVVPNVHKETEEIKTKQS